MKNSRIPLWSLLISAIAFSLSVSGQSPLRPGSPFNAIASPNASSLGVFNQVEASPFTGVPNISVPLYSRTDGDLQLDVSLNYNTALVKPDLFPGTTGLGWALFAGGSITRIPIGPNAYDENSTVDEMKSYLYRNQMLNISTWASVDGQTALDAVTTNNNDFQPDEFAFNVGNFSGSFFLDHNDKWQVRSKTPGKVTIREYLQPLTYHFDNNFFELEKFWCGFSVFTEDGTEYLFGYKYEELPQSDTDPLAIEFAMEANGTNQDDVGIFRKRLIPMTWNLRKIISPGGRTITYSYVRNGGVHNVAKGVTMQFSGEQVGQMDCTENMFLPFLIRSCMNILIGSTTFNLSYSIGVVYPSYIDKITFSDGSHIDFHHVASIQLDFPQSIITQNKPSNNQIGPETSTRLKLDKFTVYDPGNKLIKQVVFNYDESPTARLFLKSVDEVGRSGAKMRYEFAYNTTPLPDYNSGKIDHWGYYIGGTGYQSLPDIQNIDALRTVTDTNAPLMQAGILTSIKYPTGGSTSFEYEPHKYRSLVQRPPLDIFNLTDDVLTGGVRIRKIISKDESGTVLSKKEYRYVKSYHTAGEAGSGVLAGEPTYMELWKFGSNFFKTFTDRVVQPLSFTNGSHITYSEVVEQELTTADVATNGYKITKYTNSNSASYRDQEPFFHSVLEANTQRFIPFNGLGYTRGNILSEAFYSTSDKLQRETTYQYSSALPGPNDAQTVRGVFYISFGLAETRVYVAYGNYTFCPYLTKRTETNYDVNGLNPSSSTVDYTYTVNNQLATERSTNSDGVEFVTTNKYPLDFTGNSQPGDVLRLKELNVVGPVIEKITYKNSVPAKIVKATRNYYCEFTPGVMKPRRTYAAPIVTPPDLSTFTFTANQVANQSIQAIVDACCNLTDTKNFTVPSITNVQEKSTVLTLHFESPSPAHGTFTYTLTGSGGEQIVSSTLTGTMVGSSYIIDLTKSYQLTAGGNYTLTLSYSYGSGYTGTSYYGTATIATNVFEGFVGLEPREEFSFNSMGNPIGYSKTKDAPEAYKWNSNNTLPLAYATNANENELFFADFEDLITDASPAHTGLHAKTGDYNVVFSPPPGAKTYKISYWYLLSGTWTFSGMLDYSAPSMNLTLGDAIDDVRIHPSDAQMTTYTHAPLIGVTSITDPNNNTKYYQYDEFNRLIIVRDLKGNVLQTYSYHLKTQD